MLAPFQRCQPELELIDPVAGISSRALSASRRCVVLRSRGEASARMATTASGTSHCGPRGPSARRPAGWLCRQHHRGEGACIIDRPALRRWDWYMSAVRLALRTGLRVRGPGVVR
jgi:hypothetical protein